MENPLKVSVVIPSYNRKNQIVKCLKSVFDAYIQPSEIMVVDDGSDDGTDELLKNHKNIKYFKQAHQGAAAARNRGGLEAHGDIIFFTDSDCVINKDCIKNALNELANNADIAIIGCRIIGITKGYFAKCHDYSHFSSFMLDKRTDRRFVCSSGLMIRKSFFNSVNGFNDNLKVAEDEDLGMRVLEKGGRIVYLPESIVCHDHGRDTLRKFLHHSYSWAKQGSVIPYLKHKNNQYNKFASGSPWYYLILAPIISLFVAGKIFFKIYPTDKKIILYFPFIYLNKFVWCLGTYKFLKNENK